MVYDPGRWWDALAAGHHSMQRFSANAAWWRAICGSAVADLRARPVLRFVRRIPQPASTAHAAAGALEALGKQAAYESAAAYIRTLAPLAEHLAALNGAQDGLRFSLEAGAHVAGLNYNSSLALIEYSRQRTLLSDLVAAALTEAPRAIDLLVVRVTTPEDLLCALIAVRLLREHNPAMHACLADHTFEQFSLSPHMPRLRAAGTLDGIFDSIIESADDRDAVVPALAATGAPRGYLTRDRVPGVAGAARPTSPPPVPTFAPAAVLRTLLAPSARGSGAAGDRMAAGMDRAVAPATDGYGYVLFAGDALPVGVIDQVCSEMSARGGSARWSCRCAAAPDVTPDAFQRMRAAGCCEVTFNFDRGSQDRMESLIGTAGAAGLGVHAVLTIGTPGETAASAEDAVGRLSRSLRGLSGATFWLERFMLTPGSPIMLDPAAHGVMPIPGEGDIPSAYAYWPSEAQTADALAIEERHPELAQRLARELGWDTIGRGPGAAAAAFLYFVSGHGLIFKSRPDNPFANPLSITAARA
jgi:hypothetical protein